MTRIHDTHVRLPSVCPAAPQPRAATWTRKELTITRDQRRPTDNDPAVNSLERIRPKSRPAPPPKRSRPRRHRSRPRHRTAARRKRRTRPESRRHPTACRGPGRPGHPAPRARPPPAAPAARCRTSWTPDARDTRDAHTLCPAPGKLPIGILIVLEQAVNKPGARRGGTCFQVPVPNGRDHVPCTSPWRLDAVAISG